MDQSEVDADENGTEDEPGNRSLWKGSDYGWWFAADTATTASESIQGFAFPLIAQSITGSAALATLLDSVWSFIKAVLKIPGGVIQDRYDRKKLLIIEGLIGCAVFFGLSLAGQLGQVGFGLLLVVVIVFGVRDGLLGNTTNVMLRGVVPDAQLPKAMALNQGRDAASDILGAPAAALLMHVSRWTPLWVCGAFEALQTVVLLPLKRYWKPAQVWSKRNDDGDEAERPADTRPTWRSAFSGLLWLLGDPFQCRSLIASAIPFACFNSMLLISILHIGANDSMLSASALSVCVSVGVLSGSFLTSHLINRVGTGVLICATYAAMSVCSVGNAIIPNVWGQSVCLLFALFMLPTVNAAMGGFTNIMVSKGGQGRVFAGIGVLEAGFSALVTFLAGLGSDYWGYRPTALVLALCIPVFALPCLTYHGVAKIPTPDRWNDYIDRMGYSRFK